jgi:hypothetical protein
VPMSANPGASARLGIHWAFAMGGRVYLRLPSARAESVLQDARRATTVSALGSRSVGGGRASLRPRRANAGERAVAGRERLPLDESPGELVRSDRRRRGHPSARPARCGIPDLSGRSLAPFHPVTIEWIAMSPARSSESGAGAVHYR